MTHVAIAEKQLQLIITDDIHNERYIITLDIKATITKDAVDIVID